MAEEAKQYPPSERKLGRLWQAGSTPASPALVAGTVIAITAALVVIGGPAAWTWMQEWVRSSLLAAAQPESAMGVARGLALWGGVLAAGIGLTVLAGALVVQVAQRGPRSGAPPAAPAARDGSRAPRVSGWRAARAVLLTAMAAVGVTAAVRGVLVSIAEVFDAGAPLGTMTTLAAPVGWPLLMMLVAVAVLDAVADRVTWLRGASMTRREYEEEMRETEGHPLTRERRGVSARRREDA